MKTENFRVDFNGNIINTTDFVSTYGVISATGGVLSCTVASGAGNYQGAITATNLDLTGSYWFCECVNAGNQALVSLEVYPVQLFFNSTNKIGWLINQNAISARKTVAGVGSIVGTDTPYIVATHKFFRIREDGGLIFWDYSPDRVTWTNFQSELVSNLFAVTTLYSETTAGVYAIEATGTTVTFDNINVTKKGVSPTFFKTTRPRPFAPSRAR